MLHACPMATARDDLGDRRIWQVPTLANASDVFIWREDDATKNSIAMAASARYSDRELDGKSSSAKQEMLPRRAFRTPRSPTSTWSGSQPAVRRRALARLRAPVLRRIGSGGWTAYRQLPRRCSCDPH